MNGPRSLAALLQPITRQALGKHGAALPDLDNRLPGEILGYDEHGVWR